VSDQAKRRNRIVIETHSSGHRRGARSSGRQPRPGTRERTVALTVVGAAALATFVALFITSRPYDPMNSTVAALQTVPSGSVAMQPSPKPSPTVSPLLTASQTAAAESPDPSGETGAVPDDAGIQSQIERTLASDPTLSKLDVSTLVDSGRVKIVGSVGSIELKQRVEKAVHSVRGVTAVDNQLVVTDATP
jgi:hypothetical protein